MEIVYDDDEPAARPWPSSPASARSAARAACRPSARCSIDRFLEDAIEVDVDALRDAHRRRRSSAGSWSTSRRRACTRATRACAIPPPTLSRRRSSTSSRSTRARIADALDVVGLLNVQYAVKDGQVFVIEANPRRQPHGAVRGKATGVPLAKVAARVMVGATLAELPRRGPAAPAGRRRPRRGEGGGAARSTASPTSTRCSARRCARPARSWASTARSAWRSPRARSRPATGCPSQGTVFLSLADRDKAAGVAARPALRRARASRSSPPPAPPTLLEAHGVAGRPRWSPRSASAVGHRRGRPDRVGQGRPRGQHARGAAGPRADGAHIRRGRRRPRCPCLTTVAAALAAADGIADWAHHTT